MNQKDMPTPELYAKYYNCRSTTLFHKQKYWLGPDLGHATWNAESGYFVSVEPDHEKWIAPGSTVYIDSANGIMRDSYYSINVDGEEQTFISYDDVLRRFAWVLELGRFDHISMDIDLAKVDIIRHKLG